MGVRVAYKFFDTDNTEHWVELLDIDHEGAITEVEIDSPGYQINYQASSPDHLYSPFMYSQVEIPFTPANATEESIFEDLATTLEQRWYVRIYRDGNLYWVGKVLQDSCSFEDKYYPYTFRVVATDGIKSLEAVNTPINGLNTLDSIINALAETGVAQVYGTSEVFVKTCNRWVEDLMYTTTLPATTLDPLAYTRTNVVNNLQTHNNGEEDLSLLEVLRSYMIAFGCKLLMIDGCYHIIQHDEYLSSTRYFNSYTKNYLPTISAPDDSAGVVSLGVPVTYTAPPGGVAGEDFLQLTGVEYNYLPAVNNAKVRYDTEEGGRVAYRKTNSSTNFNLTETSVITSTVYGTTGASLRINYKHTVNWQQGARQAGDPGYVMIKKSYKIQIGSYFYKSVGVSGNGNAGKWIVDSNARYEILYAYPVFVPGNVTVDFEDEIITDGIPITDTVRIELTITVANAVFFKQPTFFYINWTKGDELVADLLAGGTENALDFTYSASSGVPSGYDVDLGAVLSADGPYEWSFRRLQVYNASDTTWDNTTSSWRRKGVGTAYDLLALLVQRFVQMHGYTRRLMVGSARSNTGSPLAIVRYQGFVYAMLSGSYNAAENSWSGNYMQLAESAATVDNDGGFGDITIGGSRKSSGTSFGEGSGMMMLGGVGELTQTTADADGAITSIAIESTGVNIAKSGKRIMLMDPFKMVYQELTLSADWNASDTSISVVEVTLPDIFATGSTISIPLKTLAAAIYALEPTEGG